MQTYNSLEVSELNNIVTSPPIEVLKSITVDCVVFGLAEKKLKVLLVKNVLGEHRGKWSLPGGRAFESQSLEDSAKRALSQFSKIDDIYLDQLQAFSEPNRTGNEHVISFAFAALTRPDFSETSMSSDTINTQWFDVQSLPEMVFDHRKIILSGLASLQRKIRYEPVGVNLLPEKFTLGQLQDLYEAVMSKKLDKPNFRRKMLRMNFLVRCNEMQSKVPHRAGALYRFDPEVYAGLCKQGFCFEF